MAKTKPKTKPYDVHFHFTVSVEAESDEDAAMKASDKVLADDLHEPLIIIADPEDVS